MFETKMWPIYKMQFFTYMFYKSFSLFHHLHYLSHICIPFLDLYHQSFFLRFLLFMERIDQIKEDYWILIYFPIIQSFFRYKTISNL